MKKKLRYIALLLFATILISCEKDKVSDGPLSDDVSHLIPKVNLCERLDYILNVDSIVNLSPNPDPFFTHLVNHIACDCDTLDVKVRNIPANYYVSWEHFLGNPDTTLAPTGVVDDTYSFLHVWDTVNFLQPYTIQLNLFFSECP